MKFSALMLALFLVFIVILYLFNKGLVSFSVILIYSMICMAVGGLGGWYLRFKEGTRSEEQQKANLRYVGDIITGLTAVIGIIELFQGDKQRGLIFLGLAAFGLIGRIVAHIIEKNKK